MMHAQNSQANTLEDAIYQALSLAPAAGEALRKVEQQFAPRLRRIAYALDGKFAKASFFEVRDLEDFETILNLLTENVDAGWVEEIIFDEHCMSGSWVNYTLTQDAANLKQTIKPLVNLHRALLCVHNMRQAQEIAAQVYQRLPR